MVRHTDAILCYALVRYGAASCYGAAVGAERVRWTELGVLHVDKLLEALEELGLPLEHAQAKRLVDEVPGPPPQNNKP